MNKTLEKIVNLNLTEKVIYFGGSLFLGLFTGKLASYYDNINETNRMLITLTTTGTLIYLSCIGYIIKGKEIKDKTDAIINNTISYIAPLTGMMMSYFK
ncbi:MAG: hypothetical protein AABX29_07025 [Nanoarchaeota archaeon]